MTVRTPSEIRQANTSAESAEVKRRSAAVDLALGNYNGKRLAISARTLGPTVAIRDAVAREFRAHGWSVSFVSDRRDGDFYWFGEPGGTR